MGTRSEVRVAVVAGWLRRLKERYVDPDDVDDGEELTLDVVEHVSEHLEALEAVMEAWGRRGPGASDGCRYLRVASTTESKDHDCELGMGTPRTACPECVEERAKLAERGRDEARAKVGELEGLYAAAVKRLQDLGEVEVPLTTRAAEGAPDRRGLQRGDVVEVVTALSTYHPVGVRAKVLRASERGDFTLSCMNAKGSPGQVPYGFAYRSHVRIVRRKRAGG